MALTVNKNVARGLNALGFWVGTFFTVNPDTNYLTGGYAFTAQLIKLGVIEYMAPIACLNVAATQIIWGIFNSATASLQFFSGSGGSVPSVVVTGGQAAGPALQITPDSALGVLGKTTAGTFTIPGATFGLSAVATGGLVEVANATDISGFTGTGLAFGKG